MDLETTGLDPLRHRVVEVAIIIVDLAGQKTYEYETLVNPGDKLVGPSDIHGIYPSQVSKAPCFRQVAGDICQLLRDRLFVAYNASFDASFLIQEFERWRLGTPLFSTLCLRNEAKSMDSNGVGDLHSLGVSLQLEVLPPHRALYDARMAAAILSHWLRYRPGYASHLQKRYRESVWPPVRATGVRLAREHS